MPPIALIPLNDLSRTKGRLASLLSVEQRIGLTTATFATVALAAERAGLEVVVLAANPGDVAAYSGVRVLEERADRSGLNEQLEAALSTLETAEALILHADLPLAKAAEIRRLVDATPPAPAVTIVRSTDGGTNAMLLRPPSRFPLCYGPGSFALHVEAARAASVTTCEFASETLSIDLDTPEDIRAFMEHPAAVAAPVRMILQQMLAGRL